MDIDVRLNVAVFVFPSFENARRVDAQWHKLLFDECERHNYRGEIFKVSPFVPLPSRELEAFDRALYALRCNIYTEVWVLGEWKHSYLALMLSDVPKGVLVRNRASRGSKLRKFLDDILGVQPT